MLRVLIVDDEAPARRRLRTLLRPMVEARRVEVVGEAGDGVEALEQLYHGSVDLLLLDIRMPELSGFDVLERLAPDERPVVVFTTAYDAYALRAFEINAVDYLLKPISRQRLAEAVARAERLQASRPAKRYSDDRLAKLLDWIDAQREEGDGGLVGPGPAPPAHIEQLSVPYRDRILILPVAELVSAEISEGITRLFVLSPEADGARPRLRQHIVNYTLEQLEQNLDPRVFMRVHRSAIVQLRHIVEMIPWFSGRYKLVLTGNHEVIASRERSRLLKDRLLL